MSRFMGGVTAYWQAEREFESDPDLRSVLSEPFSWGFRRYSIFVECLS
jgi:hypothetical protein